MNPLPFWVTLDDYRPGRDTERFIRALNPYGVILFARHITALTQVKELCQCVHESGNGWKPVIAVDQEGGRVSRVSKLGFDFPGASTFRGDVEGIESVAFDMGDLLAHLGFDVDFAPVADLGPASPGTGLEERLYGEEEFVVTSACAAFLRGLARAGVAGCLKHFPGLGGSSVDSHRSLPRIEGSAEERAAHLIPYNKLAVFAPYVMVSHASYEAYGDDEPATLNPAVYEVLRETGFKGLAVTDDLSMGALSESGSLTELVGRSLRAGADVALWVSKEGESLETADELSGTPVVVEAAARLCQSIGGG